MKKYGFLILLVGIIFLIGHFLEVGDIQLDRFPITLSFFGVQALVLFRIDDLMTEDKKVLASILKITIRLLSALVFLLVMTVPSDQNSNVFFIQFIALYLVFLTFENALALANLRRN